MSEQTFPPNSVGGVMNQLDHDYEGFKAAKLQAIGTALGELGVVQVIDLLGQLSAAVRKLSADQEALMGMAKEAYEETEVATMALMHTTEGTNNDHALEARAAALLHEFNVGYLRTEVFNMGGGDELDPLATAKASITSLIADFAPYERMAYGTAITVGQVIESRNAIRPPVDAYKASLYRIQIPDPNSGSS